MLLERAASLGVTGLDDLLTLPTIVGHTGHQLSLTNSLPRCPGVYLFRDVEAGCSTSARPATCGRGSAPTSPVTPGGRSASCCGTQAIDHFRCATTLEAAVREVRLIHEHEPRFNRQGTTWQRCPTSSSRSAGRTHGSRWYRWPATTRSTWARWRRPGGKRVAEAIETVIPLRRCSATPAKSPRRHRARRPSWACPPARARVGSPRRPTPRSWPQAVHGLRHDPGAARTARRSHAPARGRAALRGGHRRAERATALAQALRRQRRFGAPWGRPGDRRGRRGRRAELRHGRLQRAWGVGGPVQTDAPCRSTTLSPRANPGPGPSRPSRPSPPWRCRVSWPTSSPAWRPGSTPRPARCACSAPSTGWRRRSPACRPSPPDEAPTPAAPNEAEQPRPRSSPLGQTAHGRNSHKVDVRLRQKGTHHARSSRFDVEPLLFGSRSPRGSALGERAGWPP